jgi:L-proline amide hydrolase
MTTTREGMVAFRGYRTWYQIVGELHSVSGKLPLLVLHGGPGFPHDYLEDLAGLADEGRAVVFYCTAPGFVDTGLMITGWCAG